MGALGAAGLTGGAAHGDTSDAALAVCPDAIDLWLDTARAMGRSIPVPKGRHLHLS